MPWPEGQHVATTVCPWMGPSYPKPIQEPTRHYDIIAYLKNGNPNPTFTAWFLEIPNSLKFTKNLAEFRLYFEPKPPARKQ